MDSNHRRHSQQIYSLSPLATWVLLHIQFFRPSPFSQIEAQRSGFDLERKKETADVKFSPQGGNGTQQASSDVELVDGFEPPTC